MRIQIDTSEKVIKIEEALNLGELTEVLEQLLPNNEWKKYKLENTVITNWINPVPFQPVMPLYYPPYSPSLPSPMPLLNPVICMDTKNTIN